MGRYYDDELYHHGIKGQRWGVRRFQNEDGSLKAAGEKRYGVRKKVGDYVLDRNKYSSEATKNYTRRGDKQAAKASADFDNEITRYRQSQGAGKRAVKQFLLTPSATLTYDMARASGSGRAAAAIRTAFDINAGIMAGTMAGNAASNVAGRKETYNVGGHEVTVNRGNPAAAYAANYAVSKAMANSGMELSLQQRAIRNKYIKRKIGRKPRK